jgi:hypothetical protein
VRAPRSGSRAWPVAFGRQQIPVVWLIPWYGLLKAAERRSPKLHAIEILAQAFQRFDEIMDDHFVGWFLHHCTASISQGSDHPINISSRTPRRFVALWFHRCQSVAHNRHNQAWVPWNILFPLDKMLTPVLFFSYLQMALGNVDKHRVIANFGE